jgi:frataxin-like iron-binding protein CyaY
MIAGNLVACLPFIKTTKGIIIMNSKNFIFSGLFMVLLFGAGCVVTPERQVRTVVYAPPLPSVVVFESEPYYVYQGYHYHYQHDRWYYSRSRSGPWTSLPRDCYPREVRYRDRGPQIVIAPPLPPIVVFETEPYYVHQGYHYHYQNNGWYYSRSKSGPWTSLPRDRYPKEVRYRDGGHGHGAGSGVQVVIAPPLPPLVVFETEPYYVHQGYHYHYQNNGWYYSRSKSGPWTSLPRDRYPKEVRYRDGRHGDDKGRGPHIAQPIPEHRERIQPPQEHKSPAMPPPKYPVNVQPVQPVKPRVLPPTQSPERTYPPKENKVPVMPPTKHTQNVQPPKEGKVVLTQPVVQSPGVVTPSVGSKTQHLERVRPQKQPSVGRSGKPVSIQKGAPAKPVTEGKEALEANKGK